MMQIIQSFTEISEIPNFGQGKIQTFCMYVDDIKSKRPLKKEYFIET